MTGAWTFEDLTPIVTSKIHAAAAEGITAAIQEVLEKSKAMVPVAHGSLRDSAQVQVDSATLTASIGYGGTDFREGIVAVQQHEHTDYHHPRGGQAKFLEQPLLSSGDRSAEIITAHIREVTG